MSLGQVIDDRYEILRPLGEGGFGSVYLALQRGFDRQVALKFMSHDRLDEEMQKRFHREAKLLSMMHHPNIALFVGSGVWQQKQYTALEFVAGETLQQRLARSRPNGAEMKALALGVIAGLMHAHNAGVIHRDLKPANIVIQQSTNTPKLIDFGLASTTIDQQKLTQEGVAVGTTRYMAPEQCMGHTLTPAVDLYALGCIMYHCTTGSAPFDADDPMVAMLMRINHAPPTILTKSDAEAQYVEWLEKLLEKDPSHRYATADDAMEALRTIPLGPTDFATIAATSVPKQPARAGFAKYMWIAAPISLALLVCAWALMTKQNNISDSVDAIDTQLKILTAEVNHAADRPVEPGFRENIETELMQLADRSRRLNREDKEQASLALLGRVPWHASRLRRQAIDTLMEIKPKSEGQAIAFADTMEMGVKYMSPPETLNDLECIPLMLRKAMNCYRQTKKYDQELEVANTLIDFANNNPKKRGWLVIGLTRRACAMSDGNIGTDAERLAAAKAGYSAALQMNASPKEKASMALMMARLMKKASDVNTVQDYFDGAQK